MRAVFGLGLAVLIGCEGPTSDVVTEPPPAASTKSLGESESGTEPPTANFAKPPAAEDSAVSSTKTESSAATKGSKPTLFGVELGGTIQKVKNDYARAGMHLAPWPGSDSDALLCQPLEPAEGVSLMQVLPYEDKVLGVNVTFKKGTMRERDLNLAIHAKYGSPELKTAAGTSYQTPDLLIHVASSEEKVSVGYFYRPLVEEKDKKAAERAAKTLDGQL